MAGKDGRNCDRCLHPLVLFVLQMLPLTSDHWVKNISSNDKHSESLIIVPKYVWKYELIQPSSYYVSSLIVRSSFKHKSGIASSLFGFTQPKRKTPIPHSQSILVSSDKFLLVPFMLTFFYKVLDLDSE